MTATSDSFESSLRELGVSVSYTTRDDFVTHIDEVVTDPAVGVRLDVQFDDSALSLDETSVTVDPTPVALRNATTGVTGARTGIADYGSVVLSMTDQGSELVSLFVDRHVAVVHESDVVPSMAAGIDELHDEITQTRGSAIIATGPSATADMGALVKGAHGPKAVHVVVITEEE